MEKNRRSSGNASYGKSFCQYFDDLLRSEKVGKIIVAGIIIGSSVIWLGGCTRSKFNALLIKDLSADIYLSLYGKNENLPPQRIKAYAIYKNVSESSKTVDNFVTSDTNNNIVSVSFNGSADSMFFTFDKVFHSDIAQSELADSLIKFSVQDAIMGLNSYLIIYKLATPNSTSSLEKGVPFFEEQSSIDRFTHSLLAELLLYAKNEENMDSSLHLSYYEIHDDKVFDLLSNNHGCINTKVFEFMEQNWIELKDLTVKPIVDEKDILEFLGRKLPCSLVCNAGCCHTVISVSLIRKNVNNEGFEFIKTGTLTLVSFANCKDKNVEDKSIPDGCLLKFSEDYSDSASSKNKICEILRPAFIGNAKTCIVLLLSSELYSLKDDLSVLQFVSEIRKTSTEPELNMRLIIPDSLKEYAEEIKELQRDLNATSNGEGIMLSNMMCRYYRNFVSLENEKIKILKSQLLYMTDIVNAKEQQLTNSQKVNEIVKNEIKEAENSREILILNLKRIKNEDSIIQKASLKADEIVRLKEKKFSLELSRKKLKLEIVKTNGNNKALLLNLHGLKNEMNSLLLDNDAVQTSLNSTLELLLVDMNGTLLDFQSLEDASLKILNNLSDTCDDLVAKWKQSGKSLLSKLISFIDDHHKNLTAIKTLMSTSEPHQTSQNGILKIIKDTRTENWSNLSYYFGKVLFFCQSMFKILADIMHQLDVIEKCFKAKIKSIGGALSSSSKTLKKFINDSKTALMSFQYYFEVQHKELLNITDITCLHHNFKKDFDEKLDDLKQGLLALKNMCLKHNDVAMQKYNEFHKVYENTMKEHFDLSDHLFVFHKEVSKYSSNLTQQSLTSLESSPLRDKINHLEHRSHQLLQLQKDAKNNIMEAFDIHRQGVDKELSEVNKYVENQKIEIENYFEDNILKIMANVKQFYNELSYLQQTFFTSKSELSKILDSLLSNTSNITAIYNSYKSVSSSILEKNERSFQIMPSVIENKNDNMPDIESIVLDDWDVMTSTPKILSKKDRSFSCEKERLLCHVKSILEQQNLQRDRNLNSEGEENKAVNTSTVSLPNMSTFSKVSAMKGKSFSKLKFSKKQ